MSQHKWFENVFSLTEIKFLRKTSNVEPEKETFSFNFDERPKGRQRLSETRKKQERLEVLSFFVSHSLFFVGGSNILKTREKKFVVEE